MPSAPESALQMSQNPQQYSGSEGTSGAVGAEGSAFQPMGNSQGGISSNVMQSGPGADGAHPRAVSRLPCSR